jgi:hypothetical protein
MSMQHPTLARRQRRWVRSCHPGSQASHMRVLPSPSSVSAWSGPASYFLRQVPHLELIQWRLEDLRDCVRRHCRSIVLRKRCPPGTRDLCNREPHTVCERGVRAAQRVIDILDRDSVVRRAVGWQRALHGFHVACHVHLRLHRRRRCPAREDNPGITNAQQCRTHAGVRAANKHPRRL